MVLLLLSLFLFVLIVIEMGNFLKCPCCIYSNGGVPHAHITKRIHILHLSHPSKAMKRFLMLVPWRDFYIYVCLGDRWTYMMKAYARLSWAGLGRAELSCWLLVLNHIISVDDYVPPWLNCGFIRVCIHLFHSGILIRTFGSKVWMYDVRVCPLHITSICVHCPFVS